MGYFPAFINFDNKKIVIIGGGLIAYEKLLHLLEFSINIEIIAKEISSDMKFLIDKYNLKYSLKEYEKDDIIGFDIIIAAIDNLDLQEAIYFHSRKQSCLCNCVDLQKYCDFIFPSYIKKGPLTIAISTSGTSPAMAKQIKLFLNKIIPNSVVDFLIEMKEYRNSMPKGKERMKFLEEKAKEYIKTWKGLDNE